MTQIIRAIEAVQAPKALINAYSSNGWTPQTALVAVMQAKIITSGALVANVLSDLINVAGAGVLKYLQIATTDATSRTVRIVIKMNGVAFFDSTSAAMTNINNGATLIGQSSSATQYSFERIPFTAGMTIQVASSLSETATLKMSIVYETN